MESAIYKQGEAAGERRMIQLQLEARLADEARRFVDRLAHCTNEQLEAVGRELVAGRADEELLVLLERLLVSD